jgi:hypothetical protein
LRFSWQGQHFGDLHRHFVWHVHRFGHVVVCCVFFANRIVRVVSIGNNVPIPGQPWDFGTCDEN